MHFPVRVVSAALIALSFPMCSGGHDDHDPPILGAIYPQISRDGQHIVYANGGALWRVPREGKVATRLTKKAGYDNWPAWSPDGSRIAYVNGRGSHIGLVELIDAESGQPIEIPSSPIAKDKLQFASDGQRILGMLHADGRYGLRWLDVQTGGVGEILFADQRGLRYALSHDDRSIALATTQDVVGEQGGNNGPQCDLWIMNSERGKPKN